MQHCLLSSSDHPDNTHQVGLVGTNAELEGPPSGCVHVTVHEKTAHAPNTRHLNEPGREGGREGGEGGREREGGRE